jgi:hypothetical protein
MPNATADEYLLLMRQVLRDVAPWFPATAIVPDVSLSAEIGLDSLTMTNFAIAFEKALGQPVGLDLWLADQAPTEQDTMIQLATWLVGRCGG